MQGKGDLRAGNARAAVAILAVALTLRLVWTALIPVDPVSDSFAYDSFARTLVEHGVYGWRPDQPSAYWPVGTAAVYAGLYSVFGFNYIAIAMFNVVLSCGIVALTIWLCRLLFDQTTALIAGGLMAVWPTQIAYVTVLASELPFTFLVLLGFVVWFSPQFPAFLRALLSGLVFGAAAYFRPIVLFLPIVAWISSVPNWRKLCNELPIVVLAMALMFATIAPWSVRNTVLFGHFVTVSTNGGGNLWMGNNPAATGYYMHPRETPGLNEYERDKALGEEAIKYIIAEPAAFVLRTIKKALLLHVSETIAIHWNASGISRQLGERAELPLKMVTQTYWTIVMVLALTGTAMMIREGGPLSTISNPVILTWSYFTAVYAITVVSDRYHLPSHPFIAMLAALAIVAAARKVQARSIVVRA